MKLLSLLLSSTLLIQGENSYKMSFQDGSEFNGSIDNMDFEKNTLEISIESLVGSNTFSLASLDKISFPSSIPRKSPFPIVTTITLKKRFIDRHLAKPNPSDSLSGELIDVDDEHYTLNTTFAGPLKIKKSLVEKLTISRSDATIYDGPIRDEKWQTPKGQKFTDSWNYKKGALTSTGNALITRQLEFPTRWTLEVDLQGTGSFSANIALMKEWEEEAKNAEEEANYNLTLSPYFANISGLHDKRRERKVRFNRRGFGADRKHYPKAVLYINQAPNGENALFFNGRNIKTWKTPADAKLETKWLGVTIESETETVVSKLKIVSWDGIIPEESVSRAYGTPTKKETPKISAPHVLLANGDLAEGEVTNIEGQKAFIKTSFGSIPVPLERVTSIVGPSIENEIKMETWDVRAIFHNGKQIIFRLEGLDDTHIHGFSSAFGKAKFNVDAFSSLDFNIWKTPQK